MAESEQDEQIQLDALSSEAAKPGSVVALIEKLYERRGKIRTLVISSIDENGKSTTEISAPMSAPAVAHLYFSFQTKLSRYYTRAMFPDLQPVSPVAGVKGNEAAPKVARAVRRSIAAAQRKVAKKKARPAPPP